MPESKKTDTSSTSSSSQDAGSKPATADEKKTTEVEPTPRQKAIKSMYPAPILDLLRKVD